jgi:hypothetical protein
MTLEDFETILNEYNIRPCDFWNNIEHGEWEDILDLIIIASTKTQLENLVKAYYIGE